MLLENCRIILIHKVDKSEQVVGVVVSSLRIMFADTQEEPDIQILSTSGRLRRLGAKRRHKPQSKLDYLLVVCGPPNSGLGRKCACIGQATE